MATKGITDLAGWLMARDFFAVIPHVSPDGDALGSVLAVNHLLHLAGKRSCIISHDPPPKAYTFLPDIGSVYGLNELPYVPQWLIFVDVASPDRAGDVWKLTETAQGSALIDHHPTNTGFCEISVIDSGASATGELVAALMDELCVPLDETLAVWLYTAISTDTGNFSYSNTTPQTLRITARCIEAGLQIDEINRLLFRARTLMRTLLLGRMLLSIKFVSGGQIAYACLTSDIFKEYAATHDDAEGIINYLNEIDGVEVSVLFEERGDATKASIRSNGMVHVGKVAQSLGGGGHERAAGVTLNAPVQQAVKKVIDTIQQKLS